MMAGGILGVANCGERREPRAPRPADAPPFRDEQHDAKKIWLNLQAVTPPHVARGIDAVVNEGAHITASLLPPGILRGCAEFPHEPAHRTRSERRSPKMPPAIIRFPLCPHPRHHPI